MKRVVPVPEHCIGCRLCEMACITSHSKSGDLVIAMKNEVPEGLVSRKLVVGDAEECVALGCRHCSDAACVRACHTGAMVKDEKGRTVYDETKCVGCWACVMACEYGSIQRVGGEVRRILKCDLCADAGKPACVQACPNKALILAEED